MENPLTHEASAFINFRNDKFRDPRSHSYRWVDLKHLRFPAESGEAQELVSALIGLNSSGTTTRAAESCPQFEDLPAELEADLQERVFDRLAVADHISYLSGLDEAVHDWGRVHEHFHEFVLIDRSAGRITLLIAADD